MVESKMVPELRFKGFSDEWRRKKLNQIADIIGGGTPSTSNPEYWDGAIDWYAPAEIGDQRFADGSIRKITELGLQKSSATVLPAGRTIMFTSRAGIGKTAILRCSGATNQGFQSLVLKDGCNPYFIYSMSSNIKEQAEAVASGSTFLEISGKMLGNLEIMLPGKPEQDKIAVYFDSLDSLIILQQQKYDRLLALKKSMLERMFPKAGSDVPEIRFAGFTDAWEQRKLSEILERRQVYQKISDDAPRLAFAAGQGVIPLSERKTNNRDQLIADEASKRYLLTEYNDLVYNPANLKYGAIGRNKYGKGVISPIYVTFTTAEEPSFVERIIITERFKNKALQFEEGTVVKRQSVSPDSLLSFEEWISPYREEQVLIGKMFDKIDILIILHQRKSEKLKQLKQSLLEKMFV